MKRTLLLLAMLASDAAAHGRDPYATKIHFQPGNDQHVAAGMTIGLVTSTDGGATWRWTCEEALHYLDPFDPDYAYAQSGSIAAQTFTGIYVERGACSFDATSLGTTFVSALAAAGNVFYAASNRELNLNVRSNRRFPDDLLYEFNAATAIAAPPNAGSGIVLTDDFNPVDFYDAANRERHRRTLAFSMRDL